MFQRIKKTFNQIQGQFTYRQRFILFAFIFFIVVPFPTYWLLRTQNFLLHRNKAKIDGNQLQGVLGSILNQTLQHEIIALAQVNLKVKQTESLENLEDKIFQTLKKLKILSQKRPPQRSQSSFRSGFSKIIPQKIDLDIITAKWHTFLNSPQNTGREIIKAHEMFASQIQNELRKLEYSYELLLNPYLLLQELTSLTLNELLEAQITLARIYANKEVSEQSDLLLNVGLIKSSRVDMNTVFLDILGDLESTLSSEELRLLKNSLDHYNQAINQVTQFLKEDKSQDLPQGFVLLNFSHLILEALNANEETRQLLIQATLDILHSKRWKLFLQRFLTLFLIALSSLVIIFAILFKILTGHILSLLSAIQELGKGNFTAPQDFKAQDEFGRVGQKLFLISKKMRGFIEKLNALCQLVQEASLKIDKSVKQQAASLLHQEESTQKIETIARQIAANARSVVNKMTEFTDLSAQFDLAGNVRSSLSQAQTEMVELAQAPTLIVNQLEKVDGKVKKIKHLIGFLIHLSGQTHLLSLNAAIESDPKIKIFKEITKNVELFAAKSLTSTNAIQDIISDASQNVMLSLQNVEAYLKGIYESGNRLSLVSQQLTTITEQVSSQTAQFLNVTKVMEEQAKDAEQIMQSIIEMNATSKKNSQAVQELSDTVSKLADSAASLELLVQTLLLRKYDASFL